MIDLLVAGLVFASGAAAGVFLARRPAATPAGTYAVKGVLLPSPLSSNWTVEKIQFYSTGKATLCGVCRNTHCYKLQELEVCCGCGQIWIGDAGYGQNTRYAKAIRLGFLEKATIKAIEAS